MTEYTFRTRKPTGKPPYPLALIAGVEKAGKSYSAAAFSASDLIDRTFWIEIGEGAADQYGAIPGARYEIVEHDGTYQSIGAAIWAATQQPRDGASPHAIVIDSITELWDLLAEEAQTKANLRAAQKAAKANRPAPAEDVQITMDLWNEAKKRWRRILEMLRTYDGPVVLLARLELVTVMGGDGKPTTEREWKIRAEKNLPFECDLIVKMTAPQQASLTGVRSTVLQVPPGREMPLPGFTIDGLLRRLGLDAPGATAPRAYTAPRVDMAELAGAEAPEPRMTAQPRTAPVDDEWTTPPPRNDGPTPDPSTEPMITPGQSRAMHAIFNKANVRSRDHRLSIVCRLVGRELQSSSELTVGEASRVIDALNNGALDNLDAPPAPSDEGISEIDALMQIITDAHDEDTFETARAELQREHEAGTITGQQYAALMARWTSARNASMAGAAL